MIFRLAMLTGMVLLINANYPSIQDGILATVTLFVGFLTVILDD
jgi:predicted anti-sigma-YlaC factor YlaD